MAGVTGLEPATFCVTGRRSKPAELHPQKQALGNYFFSLRSFLLDKKEPKESWAFQDSNLRPSACKADALTN